MIPSFIKSAFGLVGGGLFDKLITAGVVAAVIILATTWRNEWRNDLIEKGENRHARKVETQNRQAAKKGTTAARQSGKPHSGGVRSPRYR
jgi:hypothetical protein